MDWKKDRIASAADGANPTVLARMKSGFAVFGDTQFLPGYCVLLGYPQVSCLNDLSIPGRAAFLTDMGIVGDALTEVLRPLRVNYDILGNGDAFLHAHIFPRYEWEEEKYRKNPVWIYPPEEFYSDEYLFSQDKYLDVKNRIQAKLLELTGRIYP